MFDGKHRFLVQLGKGMPHAATRTVPAFMPEALTASQVGTWEYDIPTGVMRGDPTTAYFFGHTPIEADEGLSIERFLQAVNPEDNAKAEPIRRRMRAQGGTFVFEMRVAPELGIPRCLLIRGAYARDEAGTMRGRGIAIDVTASKMDGNLEGRVIMAAPPAQIVSLAPLEAAAEHALAIREAVDQVRGEDYPALRATIDAFLWTVGHVLTRRRNDPEAS